MKCKMHTLTPINLRVGNWVTARRSASLPPIFGLVWQRVWLVGKSTSAFPTPERWGFGHRRWLFLKTECFRGFENHGESVFDAIDVACQDAGGLDALQYFWPNRAVMGFVLGNQVGVVFEVQCQYKLFHGCLVFVTYRVSDDAEIAVGEICLAKIATTAKQRAGTR